MPINLSDFVVEVMPQDTAVQKRGATVLNDHCNAAIHFSLKRVAGPWPSKSGKRTRRHDARVPAQMRKSPPQIMVLFRVESLHVGLRFTDASLPACSSGFVSVFPRQQIRALPSPRRALVKASGIVQGREGFRLAHYP